MLWDRECVLLLVGSRFEGSSVVMPWIQNVLIHETNSHTEKVFELAKSGFHRNMEHVERLFHIATVTKTAF